MTDDKTIDPDQGAEDFWLSLEGWPIQDIEEIVGREVQDWSNLQAKLALRLLYSNMRLAEADQPDSGGLVAMAAVRELLIVARSLGRTVAGQEAEIALANEEIQFLRERTRRKRPFRKPSENTLFALLNGGKTPPKKRGPVPLLPRHELVSKFELHRSNGLRPGQAFMQMVIDAYAANPSLKRQRGSGPIAMKREADNLKKSYSRIVAIKGKTSKI